jgi:hypothetical protein
MSPDVLATQALGGPCGPLLSLNPLRRQCGQAGQCIKLRPDRKTGRRPVQLYGRHRRGPKHPPQTNTPGSRFVAGQVNCGTARNKSAIAINDRSFTRTSPAYQKCSCFSSLRPTRALEHPGGGRRSAVVFSIPSSGFLGGRIPAASINNVGPIQEGWGP